MNIKIKISTTETIGWILLLLILIKLPAPWWFYILYVFSIFGITFELRREKK